MPGSKKICSRAEPRSPAGSSANVLGATAQFTMHRFYRPANQESSAPAIAAIAAIRKARPVEHGTTLIAWDAVANFWHGEGITRLAPRGADRRRAADQKRLACHRFLKMTPPARS